MAALPPMSASPRVLQLSAATLLNLWSLKSRQGLTGLEEGLVVALQPCGSQIVPAQADLLRSCESDCSLQAPLWSCSKLHVQLCITTVEVCRFGFELTAPVLSHRMRSMMLRPPPSCRASCRFSTPAACIGLAGEYVQL